jgi:PadR family transcriptional regulator AphA
MQSPAAHQRDVRSELLIKLALLERANIDPADLLRRQQDQLLPIAATIEDQLQDTTGFEHTLTLWRLEQISATLRFLEAAPVGASTG